MERGKLIVFEGCDFELRTALVEWSALKLKARLFKFPEQSTKIGQTLASHFESEEIIDNRALQLLSAANRLEFVESIATILESGENVVINNGIHSGIIASLVAGLSEIWADAVNQGLPKADVIILLDTTDGPCFYEQAMRNMYRHFAQILKWPIIDGDQQLFDLKKSAWRHLWRFERKDEEKEVKKKFLPLEITDHILSFTQDINLIYHRDALFEAINGARDLSPPQKPLSNLYKNQVIEIVRDFIRQWKAKPDQFCMFHERLPAHAVKSLSSPDILDDFRHYPTDVQEFVFCINVSLENYNMYLVWERLDFNISTRYRNSLMQTAKIQFIRGNVPDGYRRYINWLFTNYRNTELPESIPMSYPRYDQIGKTLLVGACCHLETLSRKIHLFVSKGEQLILDQLDSMDKYLAQKKPDNEIAKRLQNYIKSDPSILQYHAVRKYIDVFYSYYEKEKDFIIALYKKEDYTPNTQFTLDAYEEDEF